MSEEVLISNKHHEKLAKNLFNLTWDLLDKKDRNEEEALMMIHAAHASRYHWGEIGSPLQFERGEWQISRVYSVLGMGKAALYHAKKCLEICKDNNIGDFDIAFAYEAMARAYFVTGNEEKYSKYLSKTKKAAEEIEDQGNKDYVLGELASIES